MSQYEMRFERHEVGEDIAPEHKSGARCPACKQIVRVERDEEYGGGVYAKHPAGRYDHAQCRMSNRKVCVSAERGNVDHEHIVSRYVCPWCAAVREPDCGPEEHQGVQTCQECDKPFDMDYDVTVTYTTRRICPVAFAERLAAQKAAYQARLAQHHKGTTP